MDVISDDNRIAKDIIKLSAVPMCVANNTLSTTSRNVANNTLHATYNCVANNQ